MPLQVIFLVQQLNSDYKERKREIKASNGTYWAKNWPPLKSKFINLFLLVAQNKIIFPSGLMSHECPVILAPATRRETNLQYTGIGQFPLWGKWYTWIHSMKAPYPYLPFCPGELVRWQEKHPPKHFPAGPPWSAELQQPLRASAITDFGTHCTVGSAHHPDVSSLPWHIHYDEVNPRLPPVRFPGVAGTVLTSVSCKLEWGLEQCHYTSQNEFRDPMTQLAAAAKQTQMPPSYDFLNIWWVLARACVHQHWIK